MACVPPLMVQYCSGGIISLNATVVTMCMVGASFQRGKTLVAFLSTTAFCCSFTMHNIRLCLTCSLAVKRFSTVSLVQTSSIYAVFDFACLLYLFLCLSGFVLWLMIGVAIILEIIVCQDYTFISTFKFFNFIKCLLCKSLKYLAFVAIGINQSGIKMNRLLQSVERFLIA